MIKKEQEGEKTLFDEREIIMEICGYLEDLMAPLFRQNHHDPNTVLVIDAIHLLQEAAIGTRNPELIENKFLALKKTRVGSKTSAPYLVQKMLLKTMAAITTGADGARTSKLRSILADAEEAVFLSMVTAA